MKPQKYWAIYTDDKDGGKGLFFPDKLAARSLIIDDLEARRRKVAQEPLVFEYVSSETMNVDKSFLPYIDCAQYSFTFLFSPRVIEFLIMSGVASDLFLSCYVQREHMNLMYMFVPKSSFVDIDLERSEYASLMYCPELGKDVPLGVTKLAIQRSARLSEFGPMFSVSLIGENENGQIVVSDEIKTGWQQRGFRGLRFDEA